MNAPQVIPAESAAVVTTNAATILQVIERAATNPQVDIEKMERLMAMHERIQAREAEAAFNTALAECQSEVRRIAADARNDQTKSNYATYAKLDRVLRPIYSSHGFAISFDTADSPKGIDYVRVLAHVSRGAHTRTYQVDMPADGKGAKGGDVMTKTHATGAAMAYGMRYLVKGIFNVAIGEEDTDGNDPAGMPESDVLEWVKKIEATTTKEKAKEVWRDAHAIATKAKDRWAAKKLKDALIAHGEFIDKAAAK
jgi:hypothetical protein